MKIEKYELNGYKFIKHYDEKYKVKNKQTGVIYDEANDLESLNYEYEVTDILREPESEETQTTS